jgi:hypothetical protein
VLVILILYLMRLNDGSMIRENALLMNTSIAMSKVHTSEHPLVGGSCERGAGYMMTYRGHIVGMEA